MKRIIAMVLVIISALSTGVCDVPPAPGVNSNPVSSWVFELVIASLFATVGLVGWLIQHLLERKIIAQKEKQVEQAEAKVEQNPEKASPAWEVARRNLELYFQRNRAQVSQVFIIAIIVMAIGFGFVLFGVYLALQNKGLTPTLVAGISGVITQFIGATFMVIYRSTMTQANEFMSVLERINTVGMAVQVLDSIPDDEKQLKNQTRAEIVSLLLSTNINTKAHSVKAKNATPK